jgi:hypothetical protein
MRVMEEEAYMLLCRFLIVVAPTFMHCNICSETLAPSTAQSCVFINICACERFSIWLSYARFFFKHISAAVEKRKFLKK